MPEARVPILSQPEGQELLVGLDIGDGNNLFQSSPSPKARSYAPQRQLKEAAEEFQSSPSPKARSYARPTAGCALRSSALFQSSPSPKARSYAVAADAAFLLKQFQSSPSPKARSYLKVQMLTRHAKIVPILSQPEGQELPHTAPRSANHLRSSNPLPARRPGATRTDRSHAL